MCPARKTLLCVERAAVGQRFYRRDVGVGAFVGAAVGIFMPWIRKHQMEAGSTVGIKSIGDGAIVIWTMKL